MMMIRGRTGSQTADNYYPADRCTWQYDDTFTGNGYRIDTVRFFPGGGTDNVGVPFVTTVTQPVLGYIGKSGRFVETTN